MPPQPDQMLSHYRLIEKIGEGGMGVVWKAEDTKLRREVALKFLPMGIAKDPERLARFEREARMLAALNDSNVAAIHEIGRAAGEQFLVLEYVSGESLAERLMRGPLPIQQALKICCGLTRGLEAAHASGLIHRDLKPSNVQLTPDGKVKVLDFGLAKALGDVVAADERSQQMTVTAVTGEYTIVGTVPYMSPEQAMGMAVDRRTDIWAFGCILYELLTGKRAFPGDTVSNTLAKIQGQDPDWTLLPPDTPRAVTRLLRRCLKKDLDRRLRDIADARIEIEEIDSASDLRSVEGKRGLSRAPVVARWATILVLGLVLGVVGSWLVLRGHRTSSGMPSASLKRLTLSLPADAPITAIDGDIRISRQGDQVVYTAGTGVKQGLYILGMDGSPGAFIEDSARAHSPTFSPDGRWLAFSSGTAVEKYEIESGTRIAFKDSQGTSPFDWGEDNRIYGNQGLSLVSLDAVSGDVVTLRTLSPDQGEFGHWSARMLPQSGAVLFSIWSGRHMSEADIAAWIPGEQALKILPVKGVAPTFSSTGHLLYSTRNEVLAVRFDPATVQVVGEPLRLVERVMTGTGGSPFFSVSDDGTLVYLPRGEDPVLGWFDSEGTFLPAAIPPGRYAAPRFSPDGRYVAVGLDDNNWDIWIWDTERDTLSRLTHGSFYEFRPVWSPDGEWIAYSSNWDGTANLYRKRVGTRDAPVRLTTGPYDQLVTAWSPDGTRLVFSELRPDTGWDIMILDLESDSEPAAFIQTAFDEMGAQFSPDGKCVAYASNETGRFEVMVQVVARAGQRFQVSTKGGVWPRWAPDARTIYYRRDEEIVEAPVECGEGIELGLPNVLFRLPAPYGQFANQSSWDISFAEARPRFLVTQHFMGHPRRSLGVILNWTSLFDE